MWDLEFQLLDHCKLYFLLVSCIKIFKPKPKLKPIMFILPQKIRKQISIGVCLLLLLLFNISCSAQTNPPNIVMIVVDDMRFDEFGAGGHQFMETPNIDKLAVEGYNFTQAYHAVPLCSPNRASILTGQYPSRHGILDNTSRNQASFMLDLFPKDLQKAGYKTAHVGKWHMGNSPEPRPGYDYWVSFEGQGKTYDPELYENGGLHKVEGYITDIFTDRAIDFIKESSNGADPFFVYIGHKAIHPEAIQHDDGTIDRTVPKNFIPAKRHDGKYSGKTIQRRPNVPKVPQADDGKPVIQQAFEIRNRIIKDDPLWQNVVDLGVSEKTIQKRAEMMQAVDEGLGRIVNTLKDLNILNNTVIIFTSDNGYFYGEHGFSVERRMPYEESIRSPLVISFPPLENPGRDISGLVLSIDLAATVMDFVRIPKPSSIQGKSVLPLINNTTDKIRDAALVEFYSHENPFTWTAKLDYRVVRKGKYKYIRWLRFDNMDELYDLEADPYEQNNIIKDTSVNEVLQDMKKELARLQLEALGIG